MRVTRTWARIISELTVDDDIAMATHKLTGLGAPGTTGDSLRYGYAEIRNQEIKSNADIVYSKLYLTGKLLMADLATAIKNANNGLVVLDGSADVPLAQIPDTLTGKDADTLDGSHLADIAQATKEFFVPIQTLAGTTLTPLYTYAGWEMDGVGDDVYANFKIPHDFTTLTSAKIVGVKVTTGTIDWTAATSFAAIGESCITHTDSDTADGLAMTDKEIEEIDISAAFTDLAADDWIGIQFTLDAIEAGSYVVLGIVFKYA